MYRYASKHYFLRIFRSTVALLRVEVGWREGSIYAFRESVNYRCKIPYNTKSVRVCKRCRLSFAVLLGRKLSFPRVISLLCFESREN